MMKRIVAVLSGLLTMLALASIAAAGAVSPTGQFNPGTGTIVEKVHGCHRHLERGFAGPHFHAGPGCRRVAAGGRRGDYGYAPPRRQFYRDYAPRRGFCREVRSCRYIGPIKRCKTRLVC